jgi:phage-related protein
VSALRELAAVFGIQFDDQPLIDGQAAIEGTKGALKALGAAIAGSAIVMGIRDLVQEVTELGSNLNDASDRLGIAAHDLQALQYAFGQAGVRGEQVNAALTGLSQRMEQAHAGTGPAAGAFHALGIRLADAHGQMRPVNDVMNDIATSMGSIQDPARRVQISTQLFGNAGRRLVGVLHDGNGGLAEMRQRFQDLGGGLSDDAINSADAFGDALDDWRTASMSLKSVLATALLPRLTELATWVSKAIAWFSRLTRGTHVAELGLAALAGFGVMRLISALRGLTPEFWKMARAQAAAFLGVAAAVLIIDDLIALFTGGNSAIGQFIDRMFGVGTARRFVAMLREAWDGLVLALHNVVGVLSNLWTSLTTGLSSAWTTLQGWVTQVGDAFTGLWNGIDDALGGALSRAMDRIIAWVRPVIDVMSRVGQAIAHPFEGAWNAISSVVSGVAHDWADIAGSNHAIAAPATAGATTVHDNRRTTNHITVSGAGNPDQVVRRLDRHLNTQNDAAHPLPQR